MLAIVTCITSIISINISGPFGVYIGLRVGMTTRVTTLLCFAGLIITPQRIFSTAGNYAFAALVTDLSTSIHGNYACFVRISYGIVQDIWKSPAAFCSDEHVTEDLLVVDISYVVAIVRAHFTIKDFV